jgi:hypothetical protein
VGEGSSGTRTQTKTMDRSQIRDNNINWGPDGGGSSSAGSGAVPVTGNPSGTLTNPGSADSNIGSTHGGLPGQGIGAPQGDNINWGPDGPPPGGGSTGGSSEQP